VIKLFFALAIFISYNLQFYVAAEIIWAYIFNASKFLQELNLKENGVNESRAISTETKPLNENSTKRKEPKFKWINVIENLFRCALVLFTFLLAIKVPRIDLFISLVGAVASSTLAIIIPPFMDFVVFWHGPNKSMLRCIKNVSIILFGIYIFISGTYVSVNDIIKYLINN
jgi:amino acid permease